LVTSAVSGPGVTISNAETPMKAVRCTSMVARFSHDQVAIEARKMRTYVRAR
jgi:hypothetical protein